MATLAEIRAKYPDAYKDVSDQQLADAIYAKHYAGKDRREFDARIGLKPYQSTIESTATAVQNAPTRVQMGVTGLQQLTAEQQADNFTALQSAPPEELAVDANFQNYAAENGLNDLSAAAADPAVREAFFQSAGMDAAKRAVGAALTYQQQQGSLKPIDVSAGSLDYYISGAIGSTAEMLPALVASVITKNPTPGVAMILGQSAGQNYGKGRMEGLDPGRAREYATLMSSAEAIPSFLPLGQFLSAGAGNLAIDLGKGALAEAFQEGLTQALQIGIDQGYLSPDMTMGEALNQIKDAAIMGAIAGTMMDAGVRGGTKATDELYKGIYSATEAGKSAIQSILPKTQQVAAPVKEGPTMLDRVNQALQRKGFAPIQPIPTDPEIAITGEQPGTTAAPAATATSEAAAPPADGAAPTTTTETAPASTAAAPGAVSAVDQIITIESGGNPTAQSGSSSAGGLGGFIDSTWLATVRKAAPELAGESDAQILARKKDATPEGIAFQRRMVEAHIAENTASLQANGIEPTSGNLYAAHFLGAGGANTVLKAPDATPIANLVSSDVMKANPFLKGMTVGDFKVWADKKMGGAGVSSIVPGGAAPAAAGSAAATSAENAQVEAPVIPPVESENFNTAPAEVQRVGGVPADAQAEADLIETSKQQRAIVDAGQGVLAPPADGSAITTQAKPAPITSAADLSTVAQDVNPNPTPAQIEAGNYRKAHVELNGFNISIENPRGSIRRGTDTDGKAWEVTMPADYGYIKRTTGADGEQVDVYIGQSPESQAIFVVDQVDPATGAFDEHKVVMGAASRAEAALIYKSAFSDKSGAKRMGGVTMMSPDEFRTWLKEGDASKPVKAGKTKAGAKAAPKGKVLGAAPKEPNGSTPASWIIREKATGKVIAETFEAETVEGLNAEKYEAVPVGQYLASINTPERRGEVVATPIDNGTAPEHVTRGVDDRELGQIVAEFNSAQADMMDGDHPVSNVFKAPGKKEIVRLQDKAKVFHKEHGWMTPAEARAKIDEWKAHAEAQGADPAIRSANSNKVVLSLFDLSGAWSQPWEDAGYQVYRFDIQDNAETGDINNFSTEFFGDWFGDFDGMDIYAILAACPCTDFASSGARHFAAKDADGRTVASVKLVHQTLRTIEYFKPAVWAVENPVGRIEALGGLPPWRLSFDPNHLGEPYTKKTLLWGRFNADLPVAPVEPTEGSKMWSQYGGKSLATKNARSVTPEGFSYSFFMANNAHDHQAMAIANKYDRLDAKAIKAAVDAGATESDISEAVDDFYYFELDDDAANEAVRALAKTPPEPPPPQGDLFTVTTPTGGKVQVRPEVVAMDSLQKATGDLQPRDRSRAASDAQIEDMAINLDPDRLLPSPDADRGAPIVGPDGVVESGNGRRMALIRAREAYPAKYAAYVSAVRKAGYDIKSGQMLVMRRVTEMTPAERVEFVNAANTSAIARMSATEQALVDGKLIDAGVLDTLQPGVSPMAPGSKFAQAFLAKLPQAERSSLADRNGVLNADGVRRIQNALLAAAYGDAQTVAKSAENVDDNARSITGAMTDVAPEWLGMRRDIEAAGVDPSYDMTDSLMGALKLLDAARTKAAQQSRPVKALINEAVDQIDMLSGAVDPVTIEMVRAFYSEGFGRAKSRADIAAFLASITTEVQSAIQPQLMGTAPTPGEVINGARRRSEKQAEQQGDIFASRAPRGRSPASRETDGERDVQRAGTQDQQRAGAAPVASGEPSRVGELSGSTEPASGQRAESQPQDRSRTAADRGETSAQLDPELDALGVDKPMPGYVPMYAKKGVPDRPANDRIRVGNREFELPPLDRPQRREGIRVQLEGIIGPRLYVGKIKGQSMLGFYRKSNSEVRTKAYDDIEVMAHEMAHYLDFHYTQAGKFTASYKGRKDVKDLSYTSNPRAVEKEGFAEFVRLWLTQYDEAVRAAPAYVKEFEAVLRTDPTLDRQMHRLQEQMHKWFLQGPHAQLRAKSGEEYTPTEQWMQFVQSYPLEKARQNIIDNIHAAKVVERVTTGDVGDATASAYKQFQMANGAESTYSAIVEFGTPVLDVDGSLQFGGESLMRVFWPVAKHGWKRFDLLMDYFKARRGKELLGQGREKLFTPQEIKAGLKLGQQYPEFAAVFGAYQKFNQRMLDWYVSMGLITEAQREAFGEANKSYVPFHRITKMIAEGGASAGSGIGQRLAGGTANTRDIAVNIVEGLYSNVRGALVARAKATMYKQIMASQDGAMFAAKIGPDSKKVTVMLSEQARKVAQVMADLGIGISSNGFIVNEPAVDNAIYDVNEIAEVLQQRPELLDFWLVNQPPKTDGDTYVDSAIIDGEKVYFEVREPLLVDMLTGMGGMQMGAVLRAFMGVKNIQTRAVTVMPQFMIPNLVRDTLSAMALSKNKFMPVATSLRGMWDTVTKSDTFKEFMLNGGGYGNSVEARTAETRTRRQLDLPAQTNWDRAAKVLAGWDRISSSFEYGTRVGDYRLSRKAGRSPTEAAWQAREISTDFSKIGRADIWAKFLRTVPFANAGIQGLDKTARELAEMKGKMTVGNLVKLNENKAKFLLRGSILTVATLALWLLNNDDERYKALTDDERSRFWWIYLPGTKAPLKIPRPYDIGYIFASIPELMLNYAKDRDGKAAASQLAWIAINSTPVGEWPGLLQPVMEAQANKDWRGAAIVPEYMASREARYQYNERTPLMYRKLGDLLNVSPLMAEHYAQGYLRYVEQITADATEALLWNKEAWGEKPFARSPIDYATFQFTGREVPFRTKWTDGYYELKRRAEGAQSAFTALKAEALHNGEPLEGFLSNETNKALVAVNRMFSRMDRQLATGADMVMAITYDPSLSRAEKERRINAWYAQKNAAMAGMFEQVDTILKDIAAP